MAMLLLLLVLVLLQENRGSAQEFILIESAVDEGAVCLDGSPPAYEIARGFAEGSENWLVLLEGGGWCDEAERCRARQSSEFGSSYLMQPLRHNQGIFSDSEDLNPDFFDWTKVTMRYCDGSSFTGDVEEVDPVTKNYFRGARVFDAIVEDLMGNGLSSASNVLLAGVSAGGLAALVHCDNFRALFAESVRVKCLSDAGYFAHVKDLSGRHHFDNFFDDVVNIHGSAKNLPLGCISVEKPPSRCFYPQYDVPYIWSPIFILHSAFDTYQIKEILAHWAAGPQQPFHECIKDLNKCSPMQQQRLQEFRSDFLAALPISGNSSSIGYFINSCYTHHQSMDQLKWSGDSTSSKVDNKSISQAVGDWFFERDISQRIDNQHLLPYNCT